MNWEKKYSTVKVLRMDQGGRRIILQWHAKIRVYSSMVVATPELSFSNYLEGAVSSYMIERKSCEVGNIFTSALHVLTSPQMFEQTFDHQIFVLCAAMDGFEQPDIYEAIAGKPSTLVLPNLIGFSGSTVMIHHTLAVNCSGLSSCLGEGWRNVPVRNISRRKVQHSLSLERALRMVLSTPSGNLDLKIARHYREGS